MPNTRDIRNRIRGVKNTQKITRAMQLVAASKMKRAQDRALEGRPYANRWADAGLPDRQGGGFQPSVS
jgi:F-type H+-transporting ATPase subunit gamma